MKDDLTVNLPSLCSHVLTMPVSFEGCVYGGHLSAVLLPEKKFVQVPARKAYQPYGYVLVCSAVGGIESLRAICITVKATYLQLVSILSISITSHLPSASQEVPLSQDVRMVQ
jgi:hypothetical protein